MEQYAPFVYGKLLGGKEPVLEIGFHDVLQCSKLPLGVYVPSTDPPEFNGGVMDAFHYLGEREQQMFLGLCRITGIERVVFKGIHRLHVIKGPVHDWYPRLRELTELFTRLFPGAEVGFDIREQD